MTVLRVWLAVGRASGRGGKSWAKDGSAEERDGNNGGAHDVDLSLIKGSDVFGGADWVANVQIEAVVKRKARDVCSVERKRDTEERR